MRDCFLTMIGRPTPNQLQQFFTPLVGSSEAAAQLEETLRVAVRVPEGEDFFATNPYTRLNDAVRESMTTAATDIGKPWLQHKLLRLGNVSTLIIRDALEAVGDIYSREAQVPQESRAVQRSVNNILGRVVTMAYADQRTGMINRYALARGDDPNRPGAWLRSCLRDLTLGRPRMNRESFAVESDENKQLNISFRYAWRKPWRKKHRKCPASDVKVELSDGNRSALSVFSKIIGRVAITEIYPNLVSIIDVE